MRIVLFFALASFFLAQCQNAPTAPAASEQQSPAPETAATQATPATGQAAPAEHDHEIAHKSGGMVSKLLEKAQQNAPAPRFANTIDFICEMEVQPDYTDTCHYQGKVYAFCSEHCKEEFKADPKKYLKQ